MKDEPEDGEPGYLDIEEVETAELPPEPPVPAGSHRVNERYPAYQQTTRPRDQPTSTYPVSRPMSILWPASLFIVVLLLGVMLAVVSRSDTAEAEPKTEADLEIEEGMVFFQLDDIENGSYRMTISIYLTNYGEETSGDIRVNIYAENKFNDIVYDSANRTVEPIGGRKTIEVTIPIELPDNNSFRIRIFLFEAGLIKIQGYGEVSLTNVDQTVVEYTDADNDAPEDTFNSDDSAGSLGNRSIGDGGFNSSFIGALCIIGVVVLIVIIFIATGGTRKGQGGMKV